MGEMSFNAKTLDEAITKACVELGITSDKITYKVIDQGSKGFLGIGARNCVINVTVNEEAENKKPANIKKNEEIKQEATEDNEKLKKEEGFEKKENISPAAENKACEENARPEQKEKTGSIDIEQNSRKEKNERGSDKRQDYSRKRDRRGSEKNHDSNEEFSASDRERRPVVLTENPVERAKTFLETLFSAMEMKIDYSGKYDADANELIVNLSGDDMGVLIGKRGQTLDSLQYLTNQVVNKHQNGYIRVKLDTENYRERRRDTLETFAVNMAHKVRRNKRPVVLEPMNAYERRIIHSALQNEKDVTTRSEGEEPYRHVVICPIRKRSGLRQQEIN